jgi:hypothetical protein
MLLLALPLPSTAQSNAAGSATPALAAQGATPPTRQHGQLAVIGPYPREHNKAWTSTLLQNGDILLYGATPLNESLRKSDGSVAITLRNRVDHGSESSQSWYHNPLLWRADKRAWVKLEPAPECPHNAFLPTATALGDGRVWLAGGLCDTPHDGNDHSVRPAYHATSIWNNNKKAWESGPALQQPRVYHSATRLNDGSVLLVGGMSDPALAPDQDEPVLASAEQWRNNEMRPLAALAQARARHVATLLSDGNVLITGGSDARGQPLASVELWDSRAGQWRSMPAMADARYGHTTTLLADGKVLVVGGFSQGADAKPSILGRSEIFDPSTQKWRAGPILPRAIRDHAALLLQGGDVLLAGGGAFSPSGEKIDWAWLFERRTESWLPAGQATVSRYEEMVTPDLFLRPDGRVRMLTGPQIQSWQRLGDSAWTPQWDRDPALAALADGRVMVVSSMATTGGRKTRADIWDPAGNEWRAAGTLTYQSWGLTRAITLPSGKVLHLGLGQHNDLLCEFWLPQDMQWRSCGEVQLNIKTSHINGLALLTDGRAVLVNDSSEALLYDEANAHWEILKPEWHQDGLVVGAPIKPAAPLMRAKDPVSGAWLDLSEAAGQFWEGHHDQGNPPRLLWDRAKQYWAYILPYNKMGKNAQFLPDGCAISQDPLALFDPTSGQVRNLTPLATGVAENHGQLLALKEGTVVIAGEPAGGVGSGFFQRKASCAGFAAQAEADDEAMPPVMHDGRAAAAATAAKVAAALAPAKEPGSSDTAHNVWQALRAGPRIVPAVIAVLVLLAWLLYRLWHTAQAGVYISDRPRDHTGERPGRHSGERTDERTDERTGAHASSKPWLGRILVYGLLLFIGAPILWNYWHGAPRNKAKTDCLPDSSACIDPKQGLIQSVTRLENLPDNHADPVKRKPHIPCRMIGVWSTIQRGNMFRLTLGDDGRYNMDPNLAGAGSAGGYHGHWMVQNRHMVWRHDSLGMLELDINPILAETADSFNLREGSGVETRFELIRKIDSSRCSPGMD